MKLNRNILILAVSEAISQIGSFITWIAVQTIVILKNGGSILDSSIILIAAFIPAIIISPFVGTILMWIEKKYLMIFSQLAGGSTILMLFMMQDQSLIIPLIVLESSFASLMTPTRIAYLPELISNPEHLEKANALLNQMTSIAKIGSPILAGILISIIGAYEVLLIDVISFFISAILLFLLPVSLEPVANLKFIIERKWQPLLNLFKQNNGLAILFFIRFISAILIISIDILLLVYIRDVLGFQEFVFGILISSIGIGNLIGGLYIFKRKTSHSPWIDLVTGVSLVICLPLTYGITGFLDDQIIMGMIISILGSLLCGAGGALSIIQTETLLQKSCPSDLIATVSGLMQAVVYGGFIIGFIFVPMIVPSFINISEFFLLTAFCLFWVSIYLLVYVLKQKDRPELSQQKC